MKRLAAALALVAIGAAACGGGDDNPQETVAASQQPPTTRLVEPAPASEQQFPDVVAAEARRAGDNSLSFDVTVSSPYDSPERYADAWRVVGSDGTVYGVRELLHDHAGEQPFTRSLDGVDIPPTIDVVTIEARDLLNGWGGATLDIELPSAEGS